MSAEDVAHVREQVLRFVRITALALVAQLLLTGFAWPGWAGLWSLLIGAAETAYRQVVPVVVLPRVSSVLASPPPSEPPGPSAT